METLFRIGIIVGVAIVYIVGCFLFSIIICAVSGQLSDDPSMVLLTFAIAGLLAFLTLFCVHLKV